VALTAALIWLQSQRQMEARARELEALVDVAIGVLENHRKLAQSGAMSEDDARTRALSVIGGLRYGHGDYFIAYRHTPTCL